MEKEVEGGMMEVVCCYEDCHCGKSPCMASIDDGIKIEKFNECFYSNVKVKWRKATNLESTRIMCLRCEKEKQSGKEFLTLKSELDQLKQENESLKSTCDTLDKSVSSQREFILKLQQNQAKLIEALKPISERCDELLRIWGNDIDDEQFQIYKKASQTMKEVCGGSNKE